MPIKFMVNVWLSFKECSRFGNHTCLAGFTTPHIANLLENRAGFGATVVEKIQFRQNTAIKIKPIQNPESNSFPTRRIVILSAS